MNCLIVLILVNTTNLGIYAVAGVSKLSAMLIYLTFTPIYASKCLNISKKTFYPIMIRYFICAIFLTVFMSCFKMLLPEIISWRYFLMECTLIGLFACVINSFTFLNKEERLFLLKTLKQKIIKRKCKGES